MHFFMEVIQLKVQNSLTVEVYYVRASYAIGHNGYGNVDFNSNSLCIQNTT